MHNTATHRVTPKEEEMFSESVSKNDRKTCRCNPLPVFSSGTTIGILGDLIGLGGAQFRLPLLTGAFRFEALEAVMINKVVSLVNVVSALPFRAATAPFSSILERYDVLVILLWGSLFGGMVSKSFWLQVFKQKR